MKFKSAVLTLLLTCALTSAYAEPSDEGFESPMIAVSNQYTDPDRKVLPSELGDLSYEEARTVILDINQRMNVLRAEKGLAPHALNDRVSWWAQQHSEWMAVGRYPLGHEGFTERYNAIVSELPQIDGAGENVISIPRSFTQPAEEAVTQWMNSSGHRFNILADYNLAGFGIARAPWSNKWYITAFFTWTGDQQLIDQTLAAAPEWNPYNVKPAEDPVLQLGNDVFGKFNQIRQQHSLPALKQSDLLNQLTKGHSQAIARGLYPIGDTDFGERWIAIYDGLPDISRVIEWYAKVPENHPDPSQAAVDQWVADLGRFGELIFTYNAFGCGVAKSADGFYYFTVSLVNTTHPDYAKK